MLINLRTESNRKEAQQTQVELLNRLPDSIASPCQLSCSYQVASYPGYYVLTLHVEAEIRVICQRCLQSFNYKYNNNTNLALCESEALAEKLLADYETLVSTSYEVDLIDILTDELHLYCPNSHPDSKDCDQAIYNYLDDSEQDSLN